MTDRQRAIAKAHDIKHAARDFTIFQDETAVILARELLELVEENEKLKTANMYDDRDLNRAYANEPATPEWIEKHHCAYRTAFQARGQELDQLRAERDAAILELEKAVGKVGRAREALTKAGNELGVPQPGYPAPVANAAEIISACLKELEGS